MKKAIIMVLLAASFLFSQTVSADIAGGNFVGFSYNQHRVSGEVDGADFPGDVNPIDVFFLRYGFYLGIRFLAIEIHAGTSLRTINTNHTHESKIDYIGAGFARFNIPIESKKVNLYVMGGASVASYSVDTGQNTAAGGSGEANETKAGLSGGIGAEVYANDDTGMSLEWIRYMHTDDNFTGGGISLGIVHHFRWGEIF